MDTLNVGLLTALIAGFISFASPCVLPIVPGYLSFITGLGLQELTDQEKRKTIIRKAAINSILFVAGFSIIFILLGASATTIGSVLRENLNVLAKFAGAIIFILGLHMIGLIRIPFLLYEKRVHAESKSIGAGRSLIAGILFAFGWTPCIGPILAGILAIAAVQLGARRALGIDIDEWSIDNATENVRANNLGGIVDISSISIQEVPDLSYDLILANLTLNTNIELLPEFTRILRPHGFLLLSGLLLHDRAQMRGSLLQHKFEIVEELIENEWIAIAATTQI